MISKKLKKNQLCSMNINKYHKKKFVYVGENYSGHQGYTVTILCSIKKDNKKNIKLQKKKRLCGRKLL